MKKLSVDIVRDENGNIDLQETSDRVWDALCAQRDRENMLAQTACEAVHAVFDQKPGETLPVPYVVSAAMAAMNVDPTMFKETEAAVKAFLKHSDAFETAKGKNGGVKRVG